MPSSEDAHLTVNPLRSKAMIEMSPSRPTIEIALIENDIASNGYFCLGFNYDLHFGFNDFCVYPNEGYFSSPRHSKLAQRFLPKIIKHPILSVQVSSRKLAVQAYPTIDLQKVVADIAASAYSLGFDVDYRGTAW